MICDFLRQATPIQVATPKETAGNLHMYSNDIRHHLSKGITVSTVAN